MKRFFSLFAELFKGPFKPCDVLTLSRIFIFTPLIVIFTMSRAHAGWVLAAFAVGEITDAVDGPAARRWPYPEALERELWRRNHTSTIDKTADMALGIAALVYVAFCTYQPFGWILLCGILAVGGVSQLLVVFVFPSPKENIHVRRFVLVRRDLLYGPAIGVTVTTLILKATIPGVLTWDKVLHSAPFLTLFALGLTAAVLVYTLKKNRVGEP